AAEAGELVTHFGEHPSLRDRSAARDAERIKSAIFFSKLCKLSRLKNEDCSFTTSFSTLCPEGQSCSMSTLGR
ncbi:MAG: hypothetical protein ABI882_08290, partial [Acidobacteriota bacterium]